MVETASTSLKAATLLRPSSATPVLKYSQSSLSSKERLDEKLNHRPVPGFPSPAKTTTPSNPRHAHHGNAKCNTIDVRKRHPEMQDEAMYQRLNYILERLENSLSSVNETATTDGLPEWPKGFALLSIVILAFLQGCVGVVISVLSQAFLPKNQGTGPRESSKARPVLPAMTVPSILVTSPSRISYLADPVRVSPIAGTADESKSSPVVHYLVGVEHKPIRPKIQITQSCAQKSSKGTFRIRLDKASSKKDKTQDQKRAIRALLHELHPSRSNSSDSSLDIRPTNPPLLKKMSRPISEKKSRKEGPAHLEFSNQKARSHPSPAKPDISARSRLSHPTPIPLIQVQDEDEKPRSSSCPSWESSPGASAQDAVPTLLSAQQHSTNQCHSALHPASQSTSFLPAHPSRDLSFQRSRAGQQLPSLSCKIGPRYSPQQDLQYKYRTCASPVPMNSPVRERDKASSTTFGSESGSSISSPDTFSLSSSHQESSEEDSNGQFSSPATESDDQDVKTPIAPHVSQSHFRRMRGNAMSILSAKVPSFSRTSSNSKFQAF